MKAIETINLKKQYKDKTAVDGINITVEEGKLFALLGENGAGKTTTIKMLCGLTSATSGDALIFGKSINKDINEIKKLINISPQETAVAEFLTVRENLELIAEIYGAKKNDAKKKTDEILERFHLKSEEKKTAKKLSGGMQRRLSIAMALITEPKILFLDEPTLGLDVRARHDLWKLIEFLKSKMTIILTTHYLEEAEHLADNVAIIAKGKIISSGTVSKIIKDNNVKSLEEAFLKLTDNGEEYK